MLKAFFVGNLPVIEQTIHCSQKNDYLCTNNMKRIDEWNRNSVSIA
jgi:hypothetical protein